MNIWVMHDWGQLKFQWYLSYPSSYRHPKLRVRAYFRRFLPKKCRKSKKSKFFSKSAKLVEENLTSSKTTFIRESKTVFKCSASFRVFKKINSEPCENFGDNRTYRLADPSHQWRTLCKIWSCWLRTYRIRSALPKLLDIQPYNRKLNQHLFPYGRTGEFGGGRYWFITFCSNKFWEYPF